MLLTQHRYYKQKCCSPLPVDAKAVGRDALPPEAFHSTKPHLKDTILNEGISPECWRREGGRLHSYLSETAVKKYHRDILLKVDLHKAADAGITFYRFINCQRRMLVTDEGIPPDCLTLC